MQKRQPLAHKFFWKKNNYRAVHNGEEDSLCLCASDRDVLALSHCLTLCGSGLAFVYFIQKKCVLCKISIFKDTLRTAPSKHRNHLKRWRDILCFSQSDIGAFYPKQGVWHCYITVAKMQLCSQWQWDRWIFTSGDNLFTSTCLSTKTVTEVRTIRNMWWWIYQQRPCQVPALLHHLVQL